MIDTDMESNLVRIMRWWGSAQKLFDGLELVNLDGDLEWSDDESDEDSDSASEGSDSESEGDDEDDPDCLSYQERLTEILKVIKSIRRWIPVEDIPGWHWDYYFGDEDSLAPVIANKEGYEHLRECTRLVSSLFYCGGKQLLKDIEYIREIHPDSGRFRLNGAFEEEMFYHPFFDIRDGLLAERERLLAKLESDPEWFIDYFLGFDQYGRKVPRDTKTVSDSTISKWTD
ncbi:hypothetical protein QBC44DRAFT_380334 [Cladorrhinum sp. PSN332]|nr:hypothetical protein QBC44DRAFT_380334 [Cladorrhinum sp. PSN332]